MQKVYLLLRNNQQNGPFNLEELVAFDLKPVDLIWIEGKSAGWWYPQEIEALKPHLSFLKPPVTEAPGVEEAKEPAPYTGDASKKVFVSMPAKAVEGADAKPPVIETHIPSYQASTQTETSTGVVAEVKTAYTRSLEEVQSDYTNWVYNQSKKNKKGVSKRGLAAAAIIVAIGVFAAATFQHFSTLPDEVVAKDEILPGLANELVPTEPETQTAQNKKALVKGKKPAPKTKPAAIALKPIEKSRSTAQSKYEGGIAIPGKQVPPPNEEVVIATSQKEEVAAVPQAPKEEKKKLKEKFLDLFKKKENPQKEEANPVETEDGQRRTVRRQSDASLAEQVHIKFVVPNDWMMGIKAAKVSLTNKSNQTILKATIEVLYYSEDNELLQTKTVSFGKIGAKETGTVSIPDHSFADHLEHKIISVQGGGEPVAKM